MSMLAKRSVPTWCRKKSKHATLPMPTGSPAPRELDEALVDAELLADGDLLVDELKGRVGREHDVPELGDGAELQRVLRGPEPRRREVRHLPVLGDLERRAHGREELLVQVRLVRPDREPEAVGAGRRVDQEPFADHEGAMVKAVALLRLHRLQLDRAAARDLARLAAGTDAHDVHVLAEAPHDLAAVAPLDGPELEAEVL